MGHFLSESEVYQFLGQHGFALPQYQIVKSLIDVAKLNFTIGDEVVLKGEVENVFHKSDVGLVKMISFHPDLVLDFFHSAKENFKADFKSILVVEKIKYKKIEGIPSEAFFSVRYEDSFGYVARLGVGGIHSEFWGKRHPPILIYSDRKRDDILQDIKKHILGSIWFGSLRQSTAFLSDENVLVMIDSMLSLLHHLEKVLAEKPNDKDQINLIEINPFVISEKNNFIPLDGLGVTDEIVIDKINIEKIQPELKRLPLLNPKSVAIAGVSSKKEAFGNLILKNIKKSIINHHSLFVIKDEGKLFEGIKCLPNIQALKDNPVDLLLLVVPPKFCIQFIIDICEQGCGAQIISLVAGGIGDGADHDDLAVTLKNYLKERVKKNLWIPRIIGPNSLGTVLSPLQFNSLFIPEHNLKVKFHPHGNMAFISQSGAFFITRLSNRSDLPIKYAFCIGNQIDLGLPEILLIVDSDPEIKVISLYIEGFRSSDLRAIEREIQKLKREGKQVVIYKGGRSKQGAKAAAGHTGAIAGLYDLESTILKNCGAFVCESIEEFERRSEFLSKYEKFNHNIDKVAVISNAGFETVCSADNLKEHLVQLTDKTKYILNEYFKFKGIDHLVSANNPLDLTPMADEVIYTGAIERMIAEVDLLVVSIVPQTEKLNTNQPRFITDFVKKLKFMEQHFKVPIVIVVDSGELYDHYRSIFIEHDFIVMNTIEKVRFLF